ncbi:MAG: tetratricopeptide repeat protein [Bacteroidota bacterium]
MIDEINQKVWTFRGVPQDGYDPVTLASTAFEKAKETGYAFGIARSLLNLGMGSFIMKHDFALATAQLDEAMQIFKDFDDKKWIANTMLTASIINNTAGNLEVALYNAIRGIDYYESCADTDADTLMAYYVIGTVYKDLNKLREAEIYYAKGISVAEKVESFWTPRLYAGLTNIYTEQEKYDDAIKLGLKSRNIFKTENNVLGESRALTDIGKLYKKKKNYGQALAYFLEGLEIRRKYKANHFVISSLTEIATLYIESGEDVKALDILTEAEAVAIEVNSHPKFSIIYKDLAGIYQRQGNYKQAFLYQGKLLQLTVASAAADTESKIEKLQNSLLKEKEEEIERLRNVELKNAYATISERNKEVTDSINYAKRIQQCMLPSMEELQKTLGAYFLFYQPKDIVSGDFYWTTEHAGNCYIAVCDSTGHGVPGAFMSLLNIGYLNEAVKEKNITEPKQILNYVRERLIANISKEEQQDGMDAILVCIDKASNVITYAAANNAPLLVRNNSFKELDTDKMPVGKSERMESFRSFAIEPQSGDILYLYTDGFADQFGGPKAKKFKYKTLNELLLSGSSRDLSEQEKMLRTIFDDWKGELEQVDDVCVVGIKF